ncbi:MAG: DUF3488 and transglutaminase-like domain-containing protein [Acidobacteriia bacterium]|nr:DUF3488 and transglutaminase-like domain-containing protein [Terriglobia bacterium]
MARKAPPDPAELARKQKHISVQRYFEISLLLMLTTGFGTVATTGKVDPVSILVVCAALAIKFWGYIRGSEYSLSPRAVTRISFFYIFFFALDFLIFSSGPSPLDSLLNATVHLILFTTVMKVFSARTYRDYGYLATLSFLMMLSSAVLTVGTTYLVFFTFYVIFAISTFVSYEIKRGMEAAQRPPEGPFRTSDQNRRAIENALATASVGLAGGIVLLASVLFFVIPRYRTGYLTSLSMQTQNITGFSESVNLGDIGKILRSPLVVMRVVPEGSPRQFVGVKWRGVALTSFDGQHWFNDNTEQFPLQPVSFQPDIRFRLPQSYGRESQARHPLRYRVLRAALSTDVLFAAAKPEVVSGSLRLLNLDQTDSLHSPQHTYVTFGYDVVSDIGLPSPQALRAASTDFPPDLKLLYLRLPDLNPQIAELASRITAPADNNYDRAVAVQNYLRDNFRYTLDPTAIEPKDPIGSFLFKSKSGYCEYFAAAMAVMLRTLNIPARLVNGFQTGSYNRIGKDFVVRARDAHSWVEVYFPDYGWIPFDPTPPDPHPVIPAAWDDYVDAFALFWNEWIINYDFNHQVRLARQVEQDSRTFQQEFRLRTDKLKRRGIDLAYKLEGWLMAHKFFVLLFMMAVLTSLIAAEKGGSLAELRFLWTWNFGHPDASLTPREATLTYQQLLRVLQKKGFRRRPSQTPREFALSFLGTRLGPGVLEFTRLYNLLRYGQSPVSLSRLKQILDELRK